MEKYKNLKFDGIVPGEKVIKVLHRNWFDITSQYFVVFAVIGFFALAFLVYPTIFPQLEEGKSRILLVFITNTFVLATWIYCFIIWIDYYFDIWIITSEKIINIEQKGLFVRSVSEIKYEKIQDVTVKVTGLVQTVVNYGDVFVQTAADTDNINFRKIGAPYEIKNMIVKMQKEKETRKAHDFEEAIKGGLSSN